MVALGALGSCGGDSGTTPGDALFTVVAQTGDAQFGARNVTLSEPLQVMVADLDSRPQSGVAVQWSIVQGTGGSLTTATSTTGTSGVASTQLKLGDVGTYVVQATVAKISGSPARFTAKAVDAPSVTTLAPASAKPGDTITVTGQNFSTTADENTIRFSGFRGRVVSATATQLRVVVPVCIPARVVNVQASLGAVTGNTLPFTVSTGAAVNMIALTRGQATTFTDPSALACSRMPNDVANMSLLLVPQNISQVIGTIAPYEIAGVTNTSSITAIQELGAFRPSQSFASDWELKLRVRERALVRGAPVAALRSQQSLVAACGTSPSVGDRCTFQVSNKDNKFESVTAEIKAISTRAIFYQDINAPANGLTTADFTTLGAMFDDPIYATDVATWGAPSDIDNNQKIVILMTPVVNALTPRGAGGFIAGFFYACDLLPRTVCSGTNTAEIFYALAADPTGQFSDARSRTTVTSNLPAVIAHEFQHMINFGERGNQTTDALWLSEGMAHYTEDLVADVFEARGDGANAAVFRAQNTLRANRFLRAIASTSLLSEDDASLELRGGAMLFVKYLHGRFGTPILQRLARTTLTGVANATGQAGLPWSTLLADWAIALWADDAPELAGATVNSIYTFPGTNMRTRFANSDGSYPIKPTVYNFADFVHKESLQASSESYVIVNGPATPNFMSMGFSGKNGGAFTTSAVPQISVMRIK